MPDENSGFIFQGEGQKQNFPKTYQHLIHYLRLSTVGLRRKATSVIISMYAPRSFSKM